MPARKPARKLGKSTTEKQRKVHAGDDDQANRKRQRTTQDLPEQHSPLGVDAGQDFGGSYILPGTFMDCHNDILQFQVVGLPHLSVSMPNLRRFTVLLNQVQLPVSRPPLPIPRTVSF
jgi:hypothetical protein